MLCHCIFLCCSVNVSVCIVCYVFDSVCSLHVVVVVCLFNHPHRCSRFSGAVLLPS